MADSDSDEECTAMTQKDMDGLTDQLAAAVLAGHDNVEEASSAALADFFKSTEGIKALQAAMKPLLDELGQTLAVKIEGTVNAALGSGGAGSGGARSGATTPPPKRKKSRGQRGIANDRVVCALTPWHTSSLAHLAHAHALAISPSLAHASPTLHLPCPCLTHPSPPRVSPIPDNPLSPRRTRSSRCDSATSPTR